MPLRSIVAFTPDLFHQPKHSFLIFNVAQKSVKVSRDSNIRCSDDKSIFVATRNPLCILNGLILVGTACYVYVAAQGV